MYKVMGDVPKMWDSEKRGEPLFALEDEYGGKSVVAVDDHCVVLFNGSDDRDFTKTSYWHREAVIALAYYVGDNPDLEL